MTANEEGLTMADLTDLISAFKIFAAAQTEAEENGQAEFTCPLCGGRAWWSRSDYNNHLHEGCMDCGFQVME